MKCFFFVDKEEIVRAVCINCKMKDKDLEGWFYSGLVGPWTVKCHICEKIIHEEKDEKDACDV